MSCLQSEALSRLQMSWTRYQDFQFAQDNTAELDSETYPVESPHWWVAAHITPAIGNLPPLFAFLTDPLNTSY